MSKLNKSWSFRVDHFSLLLLFFLVTLLTLFFYLLHIDKNIRYYDNYRKQFQSMSRINYEIETVFQQKYRYVDHDKSSLLVNSFEVQLSSLKKSPLREEFGEHIYLDLQNLEKEYYRKRDYLERFEALNSRLTNSIHTIFDLRKSIENSFQHVNGKQEEMHKLFLTVSQILMDMPYDKETFSEQMIRLKREQSEDKLFKYLYLHLQYFIDNIEKMNLLLKDNTTIDLTGIIQHVLDDLNYYYSSMRNEQKIIAMGFFILAFLILLLLIFNYRKERNKKIELLAFKSAIENSDNAIVITDLNRHIEYVNEAFEEHTGYTKAEVYGKNPNILKSDLVSEEVYQDLNSTLERGEKWQGELINRRKDGSLLYERASIVPIFMEGQLVQYLAIKLNITEYKRQQKILQQSATVYDTMGDGIVITDSDKKIISVNSAFIKIFGYSEEEVLGKEPMIIASLKEDAVFYKKMWHELLHQGRWSGRINNQSKSGEIIPIWLTIAVVKDKKGKIQNFIAVYTNLKEIIAMEEKAEYLAYHDSLTHLPNRANFERQIEDILALSKINNEKVAVLFIDLDRFKVINDTLGHHVGDSMLIEIAKRVKHVLKKDDVLARIGGDEFVIVLTAVQENNEVRYIAEKILTIIREPIVVQDYHLYTTASLGIAIYPHDGESRNEIIKHADSAMYHAKDKGKDNYQFYTKQLSLDVQERLNLEQELLHAIERQELALYYQPQYYLKSGKICGAEALLRWKNESLGWISPDDFISVAEETGIIIKIGYFVFEEACKAYMRWEALGLDIDSIAINISSVQFREEDIFEKLKNIMLEVGIPAHKVEIEITERFIMEYSTANMTILEDLRNIGCRIAIDDFGTGYSSMSYMKSLALDTIKIDKSFIKDLPNDAHDAEVSKAIIALSKSLGYEVTAEGIETVEQEVFLRQHECDIGQGYYFARPMNEDLFVSFVKEANKMDK